VYEAVMDKRSLSENGLIKFKYFKLIVRPNKKTRINRITASVFKFAKQRITGRKNNGNKIPHVKIPSINKRKENMLFFNIKLIIIIITRWQTESNCYQ
jgi:hypothetical protein